MVTKSEFQFLSHFITRAVVVCIYGVNKRYLKDEANF